MTSRSKEHQMKRSTADRLKEELTERIREWNADPELPYIVERAVLFGSYVNTDRESISDLDVGMQFGNRYQDDLDTQHRVTRESYSKLLSYRPSYSKYYDYEAMHICMIRYLRNGSKYISIHPMGMDRDAIFSNSIQEIDVGEIRRGP